jgi:hypothetical protein
MRIGLFVPCYIDAFFPKVGIATHELLERFGHARCRIHPSPNWTSIPCVRRLIGTRPTVNASAAPRTRVARGLGPNEKRLAGPPEELFGGDRSQSAYCL